MLSRNQLLEMGFAAIGEHVQISPWARFYNPEKIEIGDHVRIDDFCILSGSTGHIKIGSYVHIAAYSAIFGGGGVVIADYANLSSRVSLYSVNDDYRGDSMTNPTIPPKYRSVEIAPIMVDRHVIIGSGAVILPGVHLHEGVSVGALSLVKSDCAPFGIYAGTPARKIGVRSRALLAKAAEFERDWRAS